MKNKVICKKCVHYCECKKAEHIENYLMNSGCIDFKKEKMPLICRIRRWFYVSPSALFHHCTEGVRHHTKYCKDCEHFIPKIIHDGMIAGMNSVKKSIIDQLKEHEEKRKDDENDT